MPFSAPTTYTSKANSAYGTEFSVGSPLVAVSEVTDVSEDVFSMAEIGKTHLLSPDNTEEFAPGMKRPGKIALSGNFIGDDSQLAIETAAAAQTTVAFQLTGPAQMGDLTETLTGVGFFTSLKITRANNRAIGFSCELQVSGSVTRVIA